MIFKEALKLVCADKKHNLLIEDPFWLYSKVSDYCKNSQENKRVLMFYNIDKKVHVFYSIHRYGEESIEKLISMYPLIDTLISKEYYEQIINICYDIVCPGWLQKNGLNYDKKNQNQLKIVHVKEKAKNIENRVAIVASGEVKQKNVVKSEKKEVKKAEPKPNKIKEKKDQKANNENNDTLNIVINSSRVSILRLKNTDKVYISKGLFEKNMVAVGLSKKEDYDEIVISNALFKHYYIPQKYKNIIITANDSKVEYGDMHHDTKTIRVEANDSKLDIDSSATKVSINANDCKLNFNQHATDDTAILYNGNATKAYFLLTGYYKVEDSSKNKNDCENTYYPKDNEDYILKLKTNVVDGSLRVMRGIF